MYTKNPLLNSGQIIILPEHLVGNQQTITSIQCSYKPQKCTIYLIYMIDCVLFTLDDSFLFIITFIKTVATVKVKITIIPITIAMSS